jgi:hypothetical protein
MSAGAATGHGITATFGTSSYSMEYTELELSGASRNAIDVTHMTSTAPTGDQIGGKEFIPEDLADGGILTLTGHENPDSFPPLNGAAETLTLQFPATGGDSTGASWAFTCFVIDVGISMPRGDKMTRSVQVKITGVLDPTAGA